MTKATSPNPNRLRKKAEKTLKKQPAPSTRPDQDAGKLGHELSVYQIELEMQNQELRRSQSALEAAREKYFDLYDLAPVAYLSFNEKGLVTEANLTAFSLLGVDRTQLINQSFAAFIDKASQDTFYHHRREVLKTEDKLTCELTLRRKDGTVFPAELQSVALVAGERPVMRTILTDITERKRAEEMLRSASEELERRVAERTAELVGANALLRSVVAERKRSEAALHLSEETYHSLFESMTQAVVYLDAEGRVISANPAAQTMLGPILDQLKEGSSSDQRWRWIREDGSDLPLDEHPGMVALRTGATVKHVLMGICDRTVDDWRDTCRWLRVDGVPQCKPGEEKPFQAYALFNDVTDRKRAREALEKAHDELELRVQERTVELSRQADLLNLTHDAIIARDLHHRIFFWNRGAEDLYGWRSSEAQGKVKQELLKTAPLQSWQAIEEALLLRGRWEGELVHTAKEGRRITVASRQALRRDENGKAIAILEINSDITEQKRADEERQRLALAVEHTNETVIIMDSRFIIQYVNPTFTRDTGYTWEEAIGRDGKFLSGDAGVSAEARQTLEKGAPWSGVYHVKHKDGSVVPTSTSIAPVKDSSGIITHLVVVAHDITEQLKLEEQLRQAQKMEAIGTLAGGIAHDFNNVLAAILGFTEMAVEDVSDRPDVEKNLQKVLKSTMRARDLVKQILAFSRKADYARSPIALSLLIKETVKLLRASIPVTVEIVLNMTATTDTVLAAPVEVQQLLMNLVTNASLAMQEKGGALEISLNDIDFQPDSPVFERGVAPGEYVQLVVRDTGTGMTPDVMKRIFEPFFTTRGAGVGTGMGLAVVYGIVKSLNGVITVESEPGHGSTFRIILPKAQTAAKPESVQPTTIPGGRERILFVDDEDLLVQLNSERLKGLGYTVIATTSSQEALDLFRAEPHTFDLVIADQAMPKLAGIDLALMLLTIRNDIPVILCTGHSDTVSPEQAREAGIKEFLAKPLTKQELAQAVRKVLDTNVK